MRAAQLKEDLAALAALGHVEASRVLAEVEPATLRLIERASRVDWLPIEVDLELVHAIYGVAGEEGLRAWGREAVLRSIETSIFKPLVDAVVRVFGLSPGPLLRAAPQAWKTTFRGCGEMSVTVAPEGGARIVLSNLPQVLVERPFLLSISGSLEAALVVARTEGTVRLVATVGTNGAEYEATWPSR